jgi:hypothetical protein
MEDIGLLRHLENGCHLTMDKNIFTVVVPKVLALRRHDYSHFVIRTGTNGMAQKTWTNIGQRLSG